MAHVSRLGGAILAETGGVHYLIGELKEPLDFAEAGFATPPEAAAPRRYVALEASAGRVATPSSPRLLLDLEGEALAHKLADFFLIRRNGSVSERLWRLVTESSPVQKDPEGSTVIDARWLGATPDEVWEAVRDSVLRC